MQGICTWKWRDSCTCVIVKAQIYGSLYTDRYRVSWHFPAMKSFGPVSSKFNYQSQTVGKKLWINLYEQTRWFYPLKWPSKLTICRLRSQWYSFVCTITHMRLQIARLVESETEYDMIELQHAKCLHTPKPWNSTTSRRVWTKILLRLKWQLFLTTRIFYPNTDLLNSSL